MIAITQQQQPPLTNSTASTSDWIGKVTGQVIYAYDLNTLIAHGRGTTDPTTGHAEGAARKVSLPPQ